MSVHGVTKTYNDGPIFIPRQAATDYGNYYGGTPIFKVLKNGIIDFGNNTHPSYDAKPVDGADNFAMMHDKGYDALGAVGGNSLFHDWGTTPIDEMALNGWSAMSDAIGNGNKVDPYNHQKVTRQEVGALHRGIILFAAVVAMKKYAISGFIKDNIPGTKDNSKEKNYQLFLQLYLIKHDDGTYERKKGMWNQDKDGNYTPVKPPKK